MSNISELSKFSEKLKDSIKTSCINNDSMNMQTYMLVKEHGQPFKDIIGTTRMAIKEHGQPFKQKIVSTDMVREVHGQPYKANYMLFQSNEKNTDFQPYSSSDNYYKY